jgi:hypothetical protein
MKFKLVQKAVGRSGPSGMVTFSVCDERNVVRGTVSVPSAEADALVKCWKGEYSPPPKLGPAAMIDALKRGPKLSRAALLRS